MPDDWQVKLYKHLRKTLTPLCADRFENEQHGYAKARLVKLLQRVGYLTNVEFPVPCHDFIDPSYIHQFKLDVYAELWLPMDVPSSPEGYIDVVHDRIAIEISGLDTYHSKNIYAKRAVRKKEMICDQYGIPASRYFTFDKDWVFSRKYIADDAEVYKAMQCRQLPEIT